MTNPNIKAALAAAQQVLAENCGGCLVDEPCICRAEAAGAVAAFIEALPVGLPTNESPYEMRIWSPETRAAWAAAVREAAQ